MRPALTQERARELFGLVEKEARAHGVADVEASIGWSDETLTRFANNTIHQNVAECELSISVRPQEDHRTARAHTNRMDADSIRRSVADAIAIMRAQDSDDALLPMAEPEPLRSVNRYSAATAECGPAQRAARVAEAIGAAESNGQIAAGILSTAVSAECLINSRGVFAWYEQTLAVFSMTAMEESSSGWAKQSAVDIGDIDVAALAAKASRKAVQSRNPREIDPGRYTVILEPAAVLDLVGQMFGDFSATALEDKRSFLNERVGTRLFGENIHITDDWAHPLQASPAFDGEGVARRPLQLVEAGVIRDIAYSRAAAHRAGRTPTGHGFPLPNEIGEYPVNIVIAGGNASVDDMIRATQRGILVTRLWYIREVDPYEKIMTGMTRDGTFLIERGEIAGGVRNFRFNQGLIELLNHVDMLGPSVRTAGEETFDMVAPAMRAHEFHFSEVTKF